MKKKEKDFVYFIQMLCEKYEYACSIAGYDMNFLEFMNWVRKYYFDLDKE